MKTIDVTKAAFEAEGLAEAWDRVYGVVVQPGVELGDDQVFHYDREAKEFSSWCRGCLTAKRKAVRVRNVRVCG